MPRACAFFSLISSYLGRDVPNIIFVHQLSLADLGPLTARLEGSAAPTCGIALHVSKDSDAIGAVAFATSTEVFYISPTDPVASSRAGTARTGRSNLARILDGSLAILAGFGMARLALHLHHQWGLPVHGVDLSTLFTPSTRNPDSAAEFASRRIHPSVNKGKIHAVWYGDNVDDVCLRAWLSAFLAAESVAQIRAARKVDTSLLDESHLACLSKLFLNVELLEAQRPTQTDTQFDGVAADKDGRLIIQNARYKTRVRKSTQTSIIMETSHGQQVVGHAVHAEGKRTGVLVASGAFRGTIERIRIVGRKGLTHAELAREEFILLLLQGVLSSLTRSPYIRMLWLSDGRAQQRSRTALLTDPLGLHFSHINASQRQVVAAMLSQDDEPLVVVHGPPGTGKTTTIAAALDYWTAERKPTWVIAQSNVGIKNVARTLVKYDIDFRLLVSKEFYVEWHEHLYTAINRCLIRSDELFGDQVSAERKISGSSIILCTISMLSNPAIDNCGIFRLVPVERLVVDEASQIDTLEFMHLFHKFRNLEKVCMFGDPKQLPPYGKDAAPNMKTIYDFKQFKAAAYFLNTQYRMPIPLGQFISDHVYDSKLLSVHMITDRNAVCLVDVHKGEEEHAGSSWKNVEEARTVVNIVKNYYQHQKFCVITPYDAQRAEIAGQLKALSLPWEDVYNVDSFQGHEAPYVIISTVRTSAPGFLRSQNRINVMLTRCERGMVLVSNRRFLTGPGRSTLLGELALQWSRGTWGHAWIDALAVSSGRADLPGVLGRTALVPVTRTENMPPVAQSGAPRPANPAPKIFSVHFENTGAGSPWELMDSGTWDVAFPPLSPDSPRAAGKGLGVRTPFEPSTNLWPRSSAPVVNVRDEVVVQDVFPRVPQYASFAVAASRARRPQNRDPGVVPPRASHNAAPVGSSLPIASQSRPLRPPTTHYRASKPKSKDTLAHAFPPLITMEMNSETRNVLRGQWRKGSEACR